MKDKCELYLLIMCRWGDEESHSYPFGIFTTAEEAWRVGIEHYTYRGGKYDPFIYLCDQLNEKGIPARVVG